MSPTPENENKGLEEKPEDSNNQLSDASFQPSDTDYQPDYRIENVEPTYAPYRGSDAQAEPVAEGSGEVAQFLPYTGSVEPAIDEQMSVVEEQVVAEDTPPIAPPIVPVEPAKPKEPFWPRYRVAIALLVVMIFAAFFRFYGRDFDSNTHQHPDERFITGETQGIMWPSDTSELFDVRRSPMNIRRMDGQFPTGRPYSYGSLPVYLNKGTAWLLDSVLPFPKPNNDPRWWEGYDGTTQLGRTMAAFFDLITILLVFLIARRLYSRVAGLIAAALVAFSVTHIQIAHFYASDTFLVTFMMAALYFSVVLMQRPSWWAAVGAGLCVGLAVGAKVSVIPFALIVVAAVVLRALYRKHTRILGAELDDPIGMKPASAREREMPIVRHLLGGAGYLILAGVFALAAFMIVEPYVMWSFDWSLLGANGNLQSFLMSNPYYRSLSEQAGIQGGQADVPYTRQYIGTMPVVYHVQQMLMWGLGIMPGLVAIIGFGAALWRVLRGKPAEILLMAGALPYLATITIPTETKWMRYWLPLVPIFCMLAAALLVRGWAYTRSRMDRNNWLRNSRQPVVVLQRNLFPVLTVLVVGNAFLWAVAFMNIYAQDHSRIQASDWIYDNVPTTISIGGTERKVRLSAESWDDQVPLGRPPDPDNNKPFRDLSMYGPAVNYGMYDDHPPADQELQYIKGLLKDTDYVVIASNRIYGSIRHEPWRYQVQIKFYDLLFQNKLGFEHLCSNGAATCGHTMQVTPSLLGINFDDQSADESFTVYDHPAVDVFKKTSELTDEQYAILFSSALNRPAQYFSTGREDVAVDDKSLAYDQPLNTLGELKDYSWNPLAQSDTQWIGILLWLVLAYVLGLVALPIVFTVSKRLPDKGYPLAKLVGIMLLAWGIWAASNAKLLPFTIWAIIFILLLMAGVSVLCWRLGAGEQIREFIATKRSLIIYYEALFLLAFIAFLFIRLLNPDLWHPSLGGEKTMEFGFLNATLRSPWMPPADPFYGGGYINYYYYGQFVIAVLIKLIGIDPAIGINLAIPLLFALAFTAGASIVYNIVAWAQASRGHEHKVSRVAMAFGVVAGMLMLGIGNLHGIYQIIVQVNPELGNQVVTWVNHPRIDLLGINIDFAPFAGDARTEQSVVGPSRNGFDFWGPSRIIHQTINEFPFWSFLFADFHPHLIDMPFTLGVAGLAMNLAFAGPFRRRRAGRRTKDEGPMTTGAQSSSVLRPSSFVSTVRDSLSWLWGEGWAGALLFGILAVMLGTLFATNTWDMPTFAGFCGGAILVGMILAFTRRSEAAGTEETPASAPAEIIPEKPTFVTRLVLYGASIVTFGLLGAASLLAASPFLITFKNVLKLEVRALVDGGLMLEAPPGTPETATQWMMHRTTLAEFTFFWGIFVFIVVSYTILRLWTFPWVASVRSLLALFTGGGSTASRPVQGSTVFSPDAAMSLQPMHGPQLATAMAGAGVGAGVTTALPARPVSHMAFSSEVRESVEPPKEPALRMGENGEQSALATGHASEGNGLEGNGLEDNSHTAAESGMATSAFPTAPDGQQTVEPQHRMVDDHLPWVITGLESGPLREDMLETGAIPTPMPVSAPESMPLVEPDYIPAPPPAYTPAVVRVAAPARPIEQPGVIPLWMGLGMLAITGALVGLQIATGQWLLALLAALIGGIISTTLSTSRSAPAMATGLLLITALAVATGVELVYLADHLRGGDMFRMNTVFKFYVQIWLLIGAGSAAAIYYILYGVRDDVRQRQTAKATQATQATESPQIATVEPEPQILPIAAQTAEEQIEAQPLAQDAPSSMPAALTEYVPQTYASSVTQETQTTSMPADTAGVASEELPSYGTNALPPESMTRTTGPLDNWLVWAPDEEPQQAQPNGHEPLDIQVTETAQVEQVQPIQPIQPPLAITEAYKAGKVEDPKPGWNAKPLIWTAVIAVPLNLILGYTLFGGAPSVGTEAVLSNAGGITGAMFATVGVSTLVAVLIAIGVGFSKGLRWTIGHSVWLAIFGVFMAASLVFTKYGTENRVAQRFGNPPAFGTLNGLEFMKTAEYGPVQGAENSPGGTIKMKYDYEAIEWMKKNIDGLHVIAEGPYEYYRDGGMRAAAYTGLPMIVGGLHQGEQRYDWLIGDRDGQARQLYSSTDPQIALTIMSKYDIDYIYVGQLEQLRAGDGLQKFDQMVKAGVLEVVFRSKVPEEIKGTTVYKVVKAPSKIVGAPVEGTGVAGLSFTPVPTRTPTPPPTPPVDDPQLKSLMEAVAASPNDMGAHQQLVDWYRDHNFWEAAVGELENMVRLNPNDIAVRHQAGDAYQQMGQPDKALKAWEDARDIDPDNASTHNKLGIAYRERRRYDDAITEFKTAFQKDPNFNEAALHLGEAYLEKGDKENAKKAFQDTISHAQDKSNPWAVEAQKKLNEIK